MPTVQISIRLDEGLLERVDIVAAQDGISRTAAIERAIRKDLPKQEEYNRSLENPLIRSVHEQLTRPSVLRIIAKLANEQLTEEQLDWAMTEAPKVREAAKKRKVDRKTNTKNGGT